MTMIGASEYTKISKEIGWTRGEEPYPTRERAEELARLSAAGDREAYKTIFLLHRFVRSPHTDEELEIGNIIYDAFTQNRRLFE